MKKTVEMFAVSKISHTFAALFKSIHRSGCSSARLEYASGGRVVAGSNPVTPTQKSLKKNFRLFFCWEKAAIFFVRPEIFSVGLEKKKIVNLIRFFSGFS